MRPISNAVRSGVLVGTALVLAVLPQPAAAESHGSGAPAAPVPLYGGDRIESATSVCTIGFIASSGDGGRIIITDGACTRGQPVFHRFGKLVGPTVFNDFPRYGLVEVTNLTDWAPRSAIRTGGGVIPIHGAGSVPVGGTVCKVAGITGITCGVVLQLNATITFGDGTTVSGLTVTNLCTQPGEQGAPVFTGSRAVGIVLGSTVGPCGANIRTLVLPIIPILREHNLQLL